MEKINILAIQMESAIGDKFKNYEKILTLTEEYITPDTDIVILPELWTIGWACEEFESNAEELENSETVEFLSELAKQHNVNIIGGSFVRKDGNKLYNTCPVISQTGEILGLYNKNHLFSYYDDCENHYRGFKPCYGQHKRSKNRTYYML